MPTNDAADQQAARAFESTLRSAVQRQERLLLELQWYEALSQRVQLSGRLMEFAVAHALVLLNHIRSAWVQTMNSKRERKARLTRAQALPRDLECLRAPDSNAWNGLGRKKKRGRAFEAIGRAYNTHRQLVEPAAATGTAPTAHLDHSDAFADAFLLHPSSCYVPKCSATPPGLRESMRNVPGLIYTANGPANAADYGLPSPRSPSPPPSPPPRVPSPAFPPHGTRKPDDFWVRGLDIDPDMAYVVAQGRHARCAQPGYSAQRAAVDVYKVEKDFPGALDYLAKLLFPAGLGCYSKMAYSAGMEPLVDFVHGWFDLAERARAVRR
ncbi:hypothetical protein FRC09_008863 [Ceratobasidium sp. 395]|nr:hypothetical protein FRC09_008863 [Ceratobasidium sp. 395]